MLPVIALVGRPNVGKSTLFNFLTRSREALVADFAGLTRDRQYGRVKHGDRACLVVDTGGIADDAEGIESFARKQVQIALEEADLVLFMVDAREGLSASDKVIADTLRKLDKPILLVTNKVDGIDATIAAADFYSLALGEPVQIAASHGRGIPELLQRVDQLLPPADEELVDEESKGIAIAVVGRPNVGKSTLVNRLLGEERVIVYDEPGTTRDSIAVDFERNGKRYVLIDTAGLRRRGKVFETIEKFSVIKTMQAVEDCNVVVLTLDAQQDISDQDAHIAGYVLNAGRAVVVAVNKWDGTDNYRREMVKNELSRKLGFLSFADTLFISALTGAGVKAVLPAVDAAYGAAMSRLPTPKLTRVLMAAVVQHQPPKAGPFRPKLRYAHQGGHNPPIVVVHGSAVAHVSESYKRYLENTFREAFKLRGTPLRVEFRQGHNPFADRKPKPLTESEENQARRQRRRGRKMYGKR